MNGECGGEAELGRTDVQSLQYLFSSLFSTLSSNQPVEMVFKITDIVLCWVFWVSGCQMYAEAGGGGGGEGQGERKVPRVPVNMRRN